MKIIYLVLLSLFMNVYSQKYINLSQEYKAVYQFKMKHDSTSNVYDSLNLSLYISGKKSIIQDFYKEKSDSALATPNPSRYYDMSPYINMKLKFVILKDFENQNLTFSEMIGIDNLGYNEKLPLFNWKIEKEKKKIAGYDCIKATTRHRGRNYIAWFTSEIPFQDGPYKFSGLPGLIIEIYDDRRNFIFSLQSFKKNKKDILYDTKIIYTKREKILPAKLDLYYNPPEYLTKIFKDNNITISKKEKLILNPIELN